MCVFKFVLAQRVIINYVSIRLLRKEEIRVRIGIPVYTKNICIGVCFFFMFIVEPKRFVLMSNVSYVHFMPKFHSSLMNLQLLYRGKSISR